MKKINIIAKIKDPLGDEQITDTIAYLDDLNKMISYFDSDGVKTSIEISKIITIERKCSSYCLKLIVDQNNVTNTIYEIYYPKVNIEVEVETKKVINDKNKIYIEYILRMNKEEIGLYIFTLELNDF